MNNLNLLTDIFNLCIFPFLAVLTTYMVKYIKIKNIEIQESINNDLIDKYIALLSTTIENCVITTNQTYVNALKNANAFNKEAQKNAFEMTKNSVMAILTNDAKKYLELVVGDLNEYISQQIEASVYTFKQ